MGPSGCRGEPGPRAPLATSSSGGTRADGTPLFVFDPHEGSSVISSVPFASVRDSVGITYADAPSRPSVRALFGRYGANSVVVTVSRCPPSAARPAPDSCCPAAAGRRAVTRRPARAGPAPAHEMGFALRQSGESGALSRGVLRGLADAAGPAGGRARRDGRQFARRDARPEFVRDGPRPRYQRLRRQGPLALHQRIVGWRRAIGWPCARRDRRVAGRNHVDLATGAPSDGGERLSSASLLAGVLGLLGAELSPWVPGVEPLSAL